MARRRRRTARRRGTGGRFVRAGTAPRKRRRHRRTVMAFSTNPRRRVRRRRRAVARINPRRRRHYRRNPVSLGGVTNVIKQGVMDGGAVFVGQVAGRKLGAALNTMLPATILANSPAVRGILSRIAGATVTSIAARKVLPNYARFITAGAFSEVINFAVSQNATAASFLSAYSRRVVAVPRVSAYPPRIANPARVSAYPRSVGMPSVVS